MRCLVTGDRNWGNAEVFGRVEALRQMQALQRTLAVLHKCYADTIIVVGGARGADSIAEVCWNELVGSDVQTERWPAEWDKYGKRAGPIRNAQMITESKVRSEKDGHKLQSAIACHVDLANSKGTRDMVMKLQREIGDENILYLK